MRKTEYRTICRTFAAISLLTMQSASWAQAPNEGSGTSINYTDPVQFMKQGGPLMWPLLACSIATITFGLERFVSLRRNRVIPMAFVRRFFQGVQTGEFDRPTAVAFCKMNPSPTSAVFAAAMRHWGRPLQEINEAVRETGEREVATLRRNLRALNALSNIATLLGLLGTVIGMIEAFNTVAVSRSLGRAELLAHGIAVALLNTAFGLAVAIASALLYNYFAGRVERLVYDIDVAASDLVDLIVGDARVPLAQPATQTAPHPTGPRTSPKFAAHENRP